VICSQVALDAITPSTSVCYLVVTNPRLSFLHAAKLFAPPSASVGIARTAVIHPSATVAASASIGQHVVLEEGVIIGEHSVIGHNTVLKSRTVVGDHVTIGSNCTIGGVGFGYERNDQGVYEVIPHIGNVVIGHHVDIGNNTAIDRATLGSTRIDEHVKIDNCVHVAHNVWAKRGAVIIAHAMIGGSTVIGENSWIAPTAALFQGITVANNCTIGIGAVVRTSTNAGEVLVGNPARVIRTNPQ
jgi:UDP-3-O-[3-hydroxymyristoyl] glucosamine N-acyltransferase